MPEITVHLSTIEQFRAFWSANREALEEIGTFDACLLQAGNGGLTLGGGAAALVRVEFTPDEPPRLEFTPNQPPIRSFADWLDTADAAIINRADDDPDERADLLERVARLCRELEAAGKPASIMHAVATIRGTRCTCWHCERAADAAFQADFADRGA